jgi:CRP/FNR family transcriptional regulator, cyclic AMP receptor protein
MSQSPVVESLRANVWFASLQQDHFDKLAAVASPVSWPAGQVIFREGEPHEQFYLILEGHVALEIYIPNRGRTTILTVGPDEVFGWSAVVPGVNLKTAGARAIQATSAVAFDALALRTACDEDHELGYYFFRRLTNVIAGRLTATRLQLLDMYSVEQKG